LADDRRDRTTTAKSMQGAEMRHLGLVIGAVAEAHADTLRRGTQAQGLVMLRLPPWGTLRGGRNG